MNPEQERAEIKAEIATLVRFQRHADLGKGEAGLVTTRLRELRAQLAAKERRQPVLPFLDAP